MSTATDSFNRLLDRRGLSFARRSLCSLTRPLMALSPRFTFGGNEAAALKT